jgi:adenine phosphoribosyltransferase
VALALKCAFVPLRKPGKLPGPTISEEYSLEYGTDKIEMHTGHVTEGQRVVLIDDLIATGGTLCAGIKLMGARAVADSDAPSFSCSACCRSRPLA